MSTYEMDGFSSLANLFILNTSKLYRCMQHTSLPTVCGTNTRVCSSLFILFFLIRLGLQNVHAVQDRSRDMLAPLDCMKEWLAFVVFNLFFCIEKTSGQNSGLNTTRIFTATFKMVRGRVCVCMCVSVCRLILEKHVRQGNELQKISDTPATNTNCIGPETNFHLHFPLPY